MEKIVFLDRGTLPVELRKPGFPHEWQDYASTSPAEVADRLRDATIAVTNKVPVRQSAFASARNLRLIAVAATGYDCVDVTACRAQGSAVANVPGYTGASVPEHVFMMLLALRRHLLGFDRAVRSGGWQRSPHFTMFDYPIDDLEGSCLGLIGYGRLARDVEKRAAAFGMKVLIAERKGALSARPGRSTFEEVLRQSDAVSLHAPLAPDTRSLIGAAELAMMKQGALLINTARGGLVDEAALAAALKSGHLGGAGVDVLTAEPPRDGNPLLDPEIPNLIVTPHIAWSSRQALAVLAEQLILNLESFVQGKPRNLVS